MINLGTNIVNGKLKLEKDKIQQKLDEYRKLIDKKRNELMNNKNINPKKKRYESSFDSVKSPKNYEIYKDASFLNLNFLRKHNRKINYISKTNYIV